MPEAVNKEGGSSAKYRAPALVKGLEILELLASTISPITLSGISERLNKSRSEIFRMVQELEATGYISREENSDGYEITNKLFMLGLEQPRTKTLLEASLPIMRDFARRSEQSCHLAIRSDEFIIVVARIEAPGPVSFAVRVGHRQLLSRSTSGVALFSAQPLEQQSNWLKVIAATDDTFEKSVFLEQAAQCARDGHFKKASRFIQGVTDIAAPITRNGIAVASLTSPCVTRIDHAEVQELPVKLLLGAASAISADLPTN